MKHRLRDLQWFFSESVLKSPTFTFYMTLDVPKTPVPVAQSKATCEELGSDHDPNPMLVAHGPSQCEQTVLGFLKDRTQTHL